MTSAATLVAATAANISGWHDANLRSLGHTTEWTDGAWLTPDAVPSIFFSAIATRPGASGAHIAGRLRQVGWVSAYDPWSDTGLDELGFQFEGDHAWMVRQPGPLASPAVGPPPGLIVEPVRDAGELSDFEAAAAVGFGSLVPAPFTWHGPPLLDDARMHLWRGRIDGHTVAVSMGFVEAGVVGVYGVATHPEWRRQGIGTVMTCRALLADPSLPAVLQPSAMAEPLYASLGFRRFATFRSWSRP